MKRCGILQAEEDKTEIVKNHNRGKLSMKKAFLAMSSAVLFLCGCQSFMKTDVSADAVFDPIPAERKLGDELIKAYQENDADGFVAVLPQEARERFGKKEFEKTRKDIQDAMGEVEEFKFLTTLDAPGFRTYVWKVTFKRTKVMDKNVELRQETLFRLVMTTPKEGAKPFLMTFGFL